MPRLAAPVEAAVVEDERAADAEADPLATTADDPAAALEPEPAVEVELVVAPEELVAVELVLVSMSKDEKEQRGQDPSKADKGRERNSQASASDLPWQSMTDLRVMTGLVEFMTEGRMYLRGKEQKSEHNGRRVPSV